MLQDLSGEEVAALRELLRNDRRLGIAHWPIVPATPGREPVAPTRVRTVVPTAAEPAPLHPAPSTVPPPGPQRSAQPGMPGLLRLGDEGLPEICSQELSVEAARAELTRLDEGFVRSCTRCPLHRLGRTQTVFGVGHPRPELAFVGEGPGAEEDRVGEPFVGKAGQLLTRMIGAMTLTRQQVYICNTVKCRPPENRTPSEDEMEACSPYLIRQLAILRPRVIVALGRPATQTLLDTKASIGSLRGRFHEFPPTRWQGLGLAPAKVMPTFHPAYLLRSPDEKGKAWEDLKAVMRHLGIPIPQERDGNR